MSAVAKLINPAVTVSEDYDSVVITDYFQGKRGGVTLDYTGFTLDRIRAGHVIIKETGVLDSHKPMPVNAGGTAYAALPEDHEYYGFAVNTSYKGKVANGIAVRGNLNPLVAKNDDAADLGYFDVETILDDLKTAIPTFTFLGDDQ